ncbi:hypothetical protein [Hugenholtzia roseola]|uniref:hypothetical protein n=1 Tax=Hugenholtzia roseola TaxID=1002 RepID=UPI00041C8799|nr:hypothetical protein [Hugenholtzia roseola]
MQSSGLLSIFAVLNGKGKPLRLVAALSFVVCSCKMLSWHYAISNAALATSVALILCLFFSVVKTVEARFVEQIWLSFLNFIRVHRASVPLR